MANSDHRQVHHRDRSEGVTGSLVTLNGETYYRIGSYDHMAPFFITVVSSADHWLFVSTTGGLTAGRVNANRALFPYYTEDRIAENADNTGSRTIIRVDPDGKNALWEPFIQRRYSPYALTRSLYKNVRGTALIFEEVNADLGLAFRYAWRTSARFGIVKTAWLVNDRDASVAVTITDGLQNILPAQVTAASQNEFSVLLDAYKRSELDAATGLGLFSLSSRLTDLAEPSEALRANTVWQVGLVPDAYLLSTSQLDAARTGRAVHTEADIRGKRGAYFVHSSFEMAPRTERTWHLVAEVHQDGAMVANLSQLLRASAGDLCDLVEQDVAQSSDRLAQIVAGADGHQVSGDPLSTEHHFANVLYNVMRGGTFIDRYWIAKSDLMAFVRTHDHALSDRASGFFDALPDRFTVQTLHQIAADQRDPDVVRLCTSYLPLTFSRRHGDPSRPWNRFDIRLNNADGSPQLSYEGNWRDIFQNWEALAFAYPGFVESMLHVFLNATTIDGYNPYRITRDGIDWEVPEPNNAWANIGYWSDHQIIYLQKLMEVCERFYPGKLRSLLTRPIFATADVPYRIKPYERIVQDPYATIDFDWDAERAIEKRVRERGTDGKLLHNQNGRIVHTTLAEKLLNLLLAKLSNFVPDGGIWMNTQRPEWNDANNALVGKGLSVVTTAYLRRFVEFFKRLVADSHGQFVVTRELHALYAAVRDTLAAYTSTPDRMTDATRRAVLDVLGKAGSDYRWHCYTDGLSGETVEVAAEALIAFLRAVESALDRTIAANRRDDALYHAYNTLHLSEGSARIRHLYPMLEGQVAVMSSGVLPPEDAVALLHQLRRSPMYREDQHSYILYPDRELPGFMAKNAFDAESVAGLTLVQTLIDRNDPRLITRDSAGAYHFGGDLRNARDLGTLLTTLAADPTLTTLVAAESDRIHALFEHVFNHDTFTGRSGSFFAYEGLGSIYWHMVSKLLLAVQENVFRAAELRSDALPALIDAYYDVRLGLGFNKSPDVYGAFPLDPYSHTPRDQGAKQPGMTGAVKEEILTRLGELGIVVEDGQIVFDPVLLRDTERLQAPSVLHYRDVTDAEQHAEIPAGAYAFTFCRVPVVVQLADRRKIIADLADGTQEVVDGRTLGPALSASIFAHEGRVRRLTVLTDADLPANR
ncbi:MAG: hypothetical protein IPM16_00390 [Chloroflexi bacterium]|nr:hypothetical protein [Chloroflexota bacterium]